MRTRWTSPSVLDNYQYTYDLAGNWLSESVALDGGTPTVTSRTYNAANQISSPVFAYDANGNLTSDGMNSYTWDRANRLFSVNNTAYQYGYDGLGSRVFQAVNSIVTNYLLDVQPGLVQVLAQTTQGNITRFVHGPRGILAYENSFGEWGGITQDGLNSVRIEANDDLVAVGSQSFEPYGVPFGVQGTFDVPFAFTGEMRDANGLQYHRARYLGPQLGVWLSLDPMEGMIQQAMTLNRYAYVAGNIINRLDPSGLIGETPKKHVPCSEEDCYETFHYNRLAAARAANYLAGVGPSFSTSGGLDPSKYTTAPGTNSARFISISLSAGGFPMVKGTGSEDSMLTTSPTGWFAKCVNARFTGNKVWDVHDQLVKYLLGAPDVGADFDPSNLNQNNRIGEVGVEMLFPALADSRSSETVPQNLETEALKWIRVRPGDYMFGKRSSGAPGQVGIHGFVVTGIGPAAKCSATDAISALGTSFLGTEAYSLGPDPGNDIISTVPVPYVADLYGVQRGTARPFYCTVLDMRASYPDTAGFFDELRYWEFFRVPDQVSVPCERVFEPNVNAFTGICS